MLAFEYHMVVSGYQLTSHVGMSVGFCSGPTISVCREKIAEYKALMMSAAVFMVNPGLKGSEIAANRGD